MPTANPIVKDEVIIELIDIAETIAILKSSLTSFTVEHNSIPATISITPRMLSGNAEISWTIDAPNSIAIKILKVPSIRILPFVRAPNLL